MEDLHISRVRREQEKQYVIVQEHVPRLKWEENLTLAPTNY